jgi:hypothetical protein
MVKLQVRQVLEFPSLKRDQVPKDIIKREHIGLGGHGGDEGVIISRVSCEKIGENLLITEGSVGSSELGGEFRDLVEEVTNRQTTFPRRGEFHMNLHRACDRTTSEMRGLSPKIISGDSR